MTILKCDRCGREIDPKTAFIVEIGTYKYSRTVQPDHYDLCDDCKETLERWLTANRGIPV